MNRRLTAIDDSNSTQRAAVLDSVLPVLLAQGGSRTGAPRFALAEDLVNAWAPRVTDRVKRLKLYVAITSFYGTDPDSATTARIRRIAREIGVILDSFNQRDIDELGSAMGAIGDGAETGSDFAQRYYALLNAVLGKHTFLDSLRHSTAAYVKLKRDNWAQATGMLPESYKMGDDPLGDHAKPIEADVWRGYDPSRGPRPTPGRVSLVVFLDNHECSGVPTRPSEMRGDCAGNLAPLKRLQARFPDLEITVVSRAHGHFLYLKDSITPQREAELTKQWLEASGVDAPRAMTTGDFTQLPDPDSRRSERLSGNDINYSFGKREEVENGKAFLIDQDGIVVHVRKNISRYAVYEDFGELIEILLDRKHQVSQVAP